MVLLPPLPSLLGAMRHLPPLLLPFHCLQRHLLLVLVRVDPVVPRHLPLLHSVHPLSLQLHLPVVGLMVGRKVGREVGGVGRGMRRTMRLPLLLSLGLS